jgi:Protein of unknown function (DUF1003)
MTRPDPSTDGSQTKAGSNGLIALPVKLPHHPVVLEEQERRAADIQLRIADWITGFAGSMNFVYLHVALFAVWMLFIEKSPWPTLTLIVSLEAIFLSTFVIVGQNRQASFQQAKADNDLKRAGTGAQDQHRADPRDPPAHDRAAQAAHRPPQPAEEVTMAVGPRLRPVRPVDRGELPSLAIFGLTASPCV